MRRRRLAFSPNFPANYRLGSGPEWVGRAAHVQEAGALFEFEIQAREGAARAGTLRLPHGEVRTPVFMPVGTQAAVKTLTVRGADALGA
ncbi:MAG TPA: hypothetical protein VF710_23950 [Longimicrobium sp.]|jgi:hypothetical protein